MLAIHSLIFYLQLQVVICGFLNFKRERDVKAINGIILVGLVVFDIIRHIHYGYQAVRLYGNIVSILLPIIMILYSLNAWRLWWLGVVSYVFISFVSMVITFFFFPVLQMDIENLNTNSQYSVVGGTLGLLLLYLLYYGTRKAKLELDVLGLTKGEVAFVLLYLILFGFYVNSLYLFLGTEFYVSYNWFFDFSSLIGGVVGIYGIFYLITKNTRMKYAEKKEQMQKEIHQQQQSLFAKIEEQNLEVRRFKHDIDFELAKLNEYADNGNLEEISLHIAEMRDDFATRSQVEWIETGIIELNANLLTLTTMPEYKSVELKWSGGIPDKIKLSSRDKTLLFSNLFKNAFESASKCVNEKWIHVNILLQENKLKIEIKNSFTGIIKQRFDGSFITTKEDKLNHGLGTITIKKIVKKYNGNISFQHESNEFKVRIVFTGSIYI